jgi:hypothetical protein
MYAKHVQNFPLYINNRYVCTILPQWYIYLPVLYRKTTNVLNISLPLLEHFSSTNALGRDIDFNSPVTETDTYGKKECIQ